MVFWKCIVLKERNLTFSNVDVLLDLVAKYKNRPASFIIHLYPTHFKFENQVCVRLFSGMNEWL